MGEYDEGQRKEAECRHCGQPIWIVVDPQGVVMQEIADPKMTRDDIAATYAFVIRQQSEVDVAAINRAIIDRWSPSALRYIKEKAWKLVRTP